MRRAVAAVLGAAVVLAGCGSEDAPDENAPAGATSPPLEVGLTEFRLEPETLRVDEAGTYTFRAVNRGETDHALEIDGQGIEEETRVLKPGESAELTVEVEAGDYELYCPVDDHKGKGMEGDLVVGRGTTTEGGQTGTINPTRGRGQTRTGQTETGQTETGSDDDS